MDEGEDCVLGTDYPEHVQGRVSHFTVRVVDGKLWFRGKCSAAELRRAVVDLQEFIPFMVWLEAFMQKDVNAIEGQSVSVGQSTLCRLFGNPQSGHK